RVLPRQRVGAADRGDAAEVLRQGVGDGAGHAAAAGEAAEVGAVRVNAVVAAHVVEHVQHDARALAGRAAVAGRAGGAGEGAGLLAGFLPVLPAQRVVARRDEYDQRPGLLGVVVARDVQLVVLLTRVVVGRQLGGVGSEGAGDELPVEAGRGRDLHLVLKA